MEHQLPELIKSAVTQGFDDRWWLSVITLVLAVVASSVTGYFLAYAKKKGENFATKEDFQTLLIQVRRSTEVTEDVKLQLGRRSRFEERILLDRYEFISQFTLSMEQVASKLGRVRKGLPVENFLSMALM